MKIKHYIITLAAFAVAAFTTTLHASGLPAPMPEFLSQEQLVKWQADRIAAAESKKTAAREQAAIQFYTGKPYDSSSGSYLFKYRSYDPELLRWATSDPSGFPDGPNNNSYCLNAATYSLDSEGLLVVHLGVVTGIEVWKVEWTEEYRLSIAPPQYSWELASGPNELWNGGDRMGFEQLPNIPNAIDMSWVDPSAIVSAIIRGTITYPGYTPGGSGSTTVTTRNATQLKEILWSRTYTYNTEE